MPHVILGTRDVEVSETAIDTPWVGLRSLRNSREEYTGKMQWEARPVELSALPSGFYRTAVV